MRMEVLTLERIAHPFLPPWLFNLLMNSGPHPLQGIPALSRALGSAPITWHPSARPTPTAGSPESELLPQAPEESHRLHRAAGSKPTGIRLDGPSDFF